MTPTHSTPTGGTPHHPFVTVIIPVLNGVHDVGPCLTALAEQSYPRGLFEIIVVDNGSSDGTIDLLRQYDIRVVLCAERGRSRALNAGLRTARGEIVCTTDISCRPEPGWISSVVRCFSNPQVACVAGDIRMLRTHPNAITGFQERTNYMSPFLALGRRQPPFFPFADGANASFRRSLFEEIGPFEETFLKGADVEICYRMFVLTEYKLVFCRDALVWEPGEPTLAALLKQRFRMGLGWHLMKFRYPALYARRRARLSPKRAYWATVQWSKRIFPLARTALGRTFGKQTTNRDMDVSIRTLMSFAQTLGGWYGYWYLRFKGIRPIPVDTEKTLRLLEVGGTVTDRVAVV